MSDALKMIRVTLDILFSYFGTAIRITGGWLMLIIALYYAMNYVIPEGTNLYKGIYTLKGLLFNAAIYFICIIAFVSCAINWHRFVLLDENPRGVFSVPPINLIFSYCVRLVLVAFLVLVIAAGSWLVLSYINPVVYELTGVSFLPKLHIAVTYFIMMYCTLRLGLSLPLTALDQAEHTLSKTWSFSKSINDIIIIISVIYIVFWLVVGWLIAQLKYFWKAPENFIPEAFIPKAFTHIEFSDVFFFAGFIINWFYFILFIGLLTVLYGKAVEESKI